MLIQKHHNQLTVTKNLDITCGAAVVLILKNVKVIRFTNEKVKSSTKTAIGVTLMFFIKYDW